MSAEKLRIGIVGAGLIAPMHAAGFQEVSDLAQVVAVCDIDPEKANDLAMLFDARGCSDYNDLIADPEVDLVDILLPHHLHMPAAMAALEAGKHLLIEKPLATSYTDALAICKKARKVGVCFGVAENTRFIPAYQEAEKLIRSGKLGEITLVRTFLPANERVRLSSEDFWGKKRWMGGGALIDSGPHTFYLIKWLFGEVRELAAVTSQVYQVGSEVEDNADVFGTLACGARFYSGFTFTAEIPHSERLEVYGTQGSIIVDQLANPPVKYFAAPTDFEGSAIEGVDYDPMGWHYFSIVNEVKDFVRAVCEERFPSVDPLDCAYAVRVIEAAYRSANAGQRMVRV